VPVQIRYDRTQNVARQVAFELRGNIRVLACVAETAPLAGALLTCEGIVLSFLGINGDKWTIFAAINRLLARALEPLLIGLAIGIAASLGHKLCAAKVKRLEEEIEHLMRVLPAYVAADSSFAPVANYLEVVTFTAAREPR
jgi:biopolymer transport protein ExbB/TolQ